MLQTLVDAVVVKQNLFFSGLVSKLQLLYQAVLDLKSGKVESIGASLSTKQVSVTTDADGVAYVDISGWTSVSPFLSTSDALSVSWSSLTYMGAPHLKFVVTRTTFTPVVSSPMATYVEVAPASSSNMTVLLVGVRSDHF